MNTVGVVPTVSFFGLNEMIFDEPFGEETIINLLSFENGFSFPSSTDTPDPLFEKDVLSVRRIMHIPLNAGLQYFCPSPVGPHFGIGFGSCVTATSVLATEYVVGACAAAKQESIKSNKLFLTESSLVSSNC